MKAQNCTGNLLTNPGFEDGFQDWGILNNAVLSTDANTGAKAVKIAAGSNRINQAFPATPGIMYSLKAMGKSTTSEWPGGVAIKFLNSSWTPIGELTVGNALTSSYSQIGPVNLVAPPNTAYIEVSIFSSLTTDLLVDDVCLTTGGGNPCSIAFIAATIPVCNDSGTPDDPADDTFTTSISFSGNGTGWTGNFNGQTYSGMYGQPVLLGPFLVSNGGFYWTARDNDDPDCMASGYTVSQSPCSNGSGSTLPDFSAFSWNNFVINPANPGSTIFAPGAQVCIPQSDLQGVAATSFVPTSPLSIALYLSTDNTLSSNDVHFATVLQNYNNVLNTGALFGEGGNGCANFPANIPDGSYRILAKLDPNNVLPEANENNNVFDMIGISIQLGGGGGGQIDLSLVAQQLTASPAQWSNYPVKLTISNAGPQAATDVKVKFAKPTDVVYVGGNEFTASQGSFNPNGDQVWTVGSIPANGSATLTVNYFLLNAMAPVAYAQVSAANETDSDSQPNNGTPPTPVQDDEAATLGGGGGPTPQPDLTIVDLQIPNASVAAGAILSYNFDASNAGTATAPDNFTIKSYISTDQTLSANDVQDGTIQTGNYIAGFTAQNVPGASTIPANLAAGAYYLIVKVDADGVVAESNEGNNTVVKPFTVTGAPIICQGDLILESQAEVNAVPNCAIIDGLLWIRSPNGSQGASSDITDLSPLLGIQQVNGFITIENNDQLFNLHGLENIKSADGVAVVFCENLNQVHAFSGLTGDMKAINILSNPSLLTVDGFEGITSLSIGINLTTNTSLQNLNGFSNITQIGGEVHIGGNTSLTSMQGLNKLTSIGGGFILENCDALKTLNGLQQLESAGYLALLSNDALHEVSALGALSTVQNSLFVKDHPLLSDCCVFYNLLNNNGVGGSITFGNNAGNCNTEQDILNSCSGSTDPCAAITITPSPNKITIAGASAPHVLIKVFRPNWTVAYECLDGACANPTVVSNLGTGSHFVEVKLMNAGWGEICKNTQTVGVSNIAEHDERLRLNFDKFYPNPTAYLTTIGLYSPVEQAATLDFYDSMGRPVHTMEVQLDKGQNLIEQLVFDWKSGTYNVVARGEQTALPAYGRFLKVWEE